MQNLKVTMTIDFDKDADIDFEINKLKEQVQKSKDEYVKSIEEFKQDRR